MKNVFFIYPNPNRTNPRGIRVSNIMEELRVTAPKNKYELLSFSNSFKKSKSEGVKVNSFNLIYLLFRYTGIFKYGRKLIQKARVLDPYLFIHFLVKRDLQLRLKNVDTKECVFIIVVSPFSNYLLVPWLRKKYPKSKLICDIGDPLYKNSARESNESTTRQTEKDAIQSVDNIIVTNQATSRLLVQEYNINSKLIDVIPQGVSTELIASVEKSVSQVETGTLVYAGSFYNELRSPKALFNHLSTQNYFRIHIYGVRMKHYSKQIIYEGRRKQDILFKEIQSKQAIVYIDNKFGVQTSGKIYEVLSFKKPILFIMGDEKSLPYLLAKQYPNVFFAENNSKSIGKALKQMSTIEKLNFAKNREEHSWKSRTKAYIKVINS